MVELELIFLFPLGLSRNTSNNLIVFSIVYVGRPDINEETIIDLSAPKPPGYWIIFIRRIYCSVILR